MPSCSTRKSRRSGSVPASTSSRTTSPKRRARSSSSTARSRSSASSETSKSASRVTRKTAWPWISMPGNSASRWRAMATSSGTNVPSPMSTKRGSTSLGTFTRANSSRVVRPGRAATRPGSATGWRCTGTAGPGPTASGVSTGKICSLKIRSSVSRLGGRAARRRPRSGCPGRPAPGAPAPTTGASAARPARGVRSAIRSIVSDGDRPSALRASMPASTWSCRPATRTITNSSRLEV